MEKLESSCFLKRAVGIASWFSETRFRKHLNIQEAVEGRTKGFYKYTQFWLWDLWITRQVNLESESVLFFFFLILKLLCFEHTQSGRFIKLVNWTMDLRIGRQWSFLHSVDTWKLPSPSQEEMGMWRSGVMGHRCKRVRGHALHGRVWKEEADPWTKAKTGLIGDRAHLSEVPLSVNLNFRDVLRDGK